MHDFHEYLRSALGQAMMLTFAGTAAMQGLVAIWAATGRLHWFVRAIVVGASGGESVSRNASEPSTAPFLSSSLAGRRDSRFQMRVVCWLS